MTAKFRLSGQMKAAPSPGLSYPEGRLHETTAWVHAILTSLNARNSLLLLAQWAWLTTRTTHHRLYQLDPDSKTRSDIHSSVRTCVTENRTDWVPPKKFDWS